MPIIYQYGYDQLWQIGRFKYMRRCTLWHLSIILFALAIMGCSLRPLETPTSASVPPTSTPEEDDQGERQTSAPAGVFAGADQHPGLANSALETDTYARPAPEWPADLEWLNTDRPLTLAELRGKIVILDFWTYGCINCLHNFPDLKRLEAEYPKELVVIGVHSAKFSTEKETENIRRTILRYGLEHPVINDRDLRIWHAWGVKAWPTLAVVDPGGTLFGFHVGENVYQHLKPVITQLVRAYDQRLDRTPLRLKLERQGLPQTVLSFPGKVLADEAGGRLFVADTNHHRIVVADINSGQVINVIGQGSAGLENGSFQKAAFNWPQGLTLSPDGNVLYVADTANHAIRQVDLTAETVATLVGTGKQTRRLPPQGGTAPDVDLASPWDVLLNGDTLYIAMAGTHQIWQLTLPTGQITPLVGSSLEGLANGPLAEAQLAQPSGLALDDQGRLHFADSESSLMRRAEVGVPNGQVDTVAGGSHNLFSFGDVDGVGKEVRFQHPLGLVFAGDSLYVADTYNHKIKQVDPATGDTQTLAGSEPGWRDGNDPLFYEPGGIDAAGGKLYIADTNNHAIRVVNLTNNEASTLVLKGIERFSPSADEASYRGRLVALEPLEVGQGSGQVVLNIKLPAGYKVNEEAPAAFEWRVEGDMAVLAPDANRSVVAPQFPLETGVTFKPGSGQLTADLAIFYCEAQTESICLIEQVRLEAPLTVMEQGQASLTIDYEIDLPDLESP